MNQSLAAELCKPAQRTDNFSIGMTFALTALALIALLAILIEILRQGVPCLKPEVFVSLLPQLGRRRTMALPTRLSVR